MSSTIGRDRVWAAALELALLGDDWRFKTSHVRSRMSEPPSHRTVQRTLRAMTELDVLQHRDGSAYYMAGPLIRGR